MEWWSILGLGFGSGATVASFVFGFWGKWRTENKSSQTELNKTNGDLITAQRERIDFLEQALDRTNNRIGALEKSNDEMQKSMESLYNKNRDLTALIAGRDPAIQALIKKSDEGLETFIKDTAPKVADLHKHLVPKEA